MKVLIIEDHQTLRELVVEHLLHVGFVVDSAEEGRTALALLNLSNYDVIILDLGLPDIDGMTLLNKKQNTNNAHTPCIILTARDSLSSKISGLNAGADDYLLKPFDLQELEARIRAILRRPRRQEKALLVFSNLTLEPEIRRLSVAGCAKTIMLARRETILLVEMLRVAPCVVIKEQLEENLYAFNEPVTPNAIEAVVSRLRRKLSTHNANVQIETVRGLGYRLLNTGIL